MNNTIYKENVKSFEIKYNSIYKYLTDNENNSLHNINDVLWDISASEEDIMVINRNGRLYYLNSRYSDEEWRRICEASQRVSSWIKDLINAEKERRMC